MDPSFEIIKILRHDVFIVRLQNPEQFSRKNHYGFRPGYGFSQGEWNAQETFTFYKRTRDVRLFSFEQLMKPSQCSGSALERSLIWTPLVIVRSARKSQRVLMQSLKLNNPLPMNMWECDGGERKEEMKGFACYEWTWLCATELLTCMASSYAKFSWKFAA